MDENLKLKFAVRKYFFSNLQNLLIYAELSDENICKILKFLIICSSYNSESRYLNIFF